MKYITKKDVFIATVIFAVFAYVGFQKAFNFDFWRDDWGQIWAAIYHSRDFATEWAAVRLHPISAYEQVILAQFFGFNPRPWQIFGYILKVLDSLAIALLMFGLTKSKKTAFYSGVIFSVFLGGMESVTWVSAHTSAMVIILLTVGFYFWITSDTNHSMKNYWIAMVIFFLTILSDPARAFGIFLLAVFWEFMTVFQSLTKNRIKTSALRLFPFVVMMVIVRPFLARADFPPITEILTSSYKDVLIKPGLIKNIFYTLGNLLVGWFVKVQDLGGLSNPYRFSLRATLIFVSFCSFVNKLLIFI